MRLEDKVAIVTGGGSGIGAAACRLFAAEGARVAVAEIDGAAAEAVAGEIGDAALAVTVDVASSADVEAMVATVVDRFGRLDVLVNNAGYGIPGGVVETEEDDWDKLMAVNLKGVYLGCRHAIPVMREQGGGVIVNTASVVSFVGIENRAAYCASKGGVAALTRAVALDHVADNIRVNAVAPGTIETAYHREMMAKSNDPAAFKRGIEERQAMNRLGTPEEIAYAILYLAADESSFTTGTILTADGGMTAR